MSSPTLLSPAQFAALTAYVEAAVDLAEAKADNNRPDSDSGMEVWRRLDAYREARATAEKALVGETPY